MSKDERRKVKTKKIQPNAQEMPGRNEERKEKEEEGSHWEEIGVIPAGRRLAGRVNKNGIEGRLEGRV